MYSISYEKKLCSGNQTFSKSTLYSKQDQTDHEDIDAEELVSHWKNGLECSRRIIAVHRSSAKAKLKKLNKERNI